MLKEKNKNLTTTTTLASVSSIDVAKLTLVQGSNQVKTKQRRFSDTAFLSPVVNERLPAVAKQTSSESDLRKQQVKYSLKNETNSEIRRTGDGRKERRKSEILRPVSEFVEPLHSPRGGWEQQLKPVNESFTRDKKRYSASIIYSESHEKQGQLGTLDHRHSLEESENHFSEQRLSTPKLTGTTRLLPKRKLGVWYNDFNAEGRIPSTRESLVSQHPKSIQPLNGVQETSKGQENRPGSHHELKRDGKERKCFEKKDEVVAYEMQGKDKNSNSFDMPQRTKGRSSRTEMNESCSSHPTSQPLGREESISVATSSREELSWGINKRHSLDEGIGRRQTLQPISEPERKLSIQPIISCSNEKSNKQIINVDSSLTNNVGMPQKESTRRGKLGNLLPFEAQTQQFFDNTINLRNNEKDSTKRQFDINNNVVSKSTDSTFSSQSEEKSNKKVNLHVSSNAMAGHHVDDPGSKENGVGKENRAKSMLHSEGESEPTQASSKEIDKTIKKARPNELKHLRRSYSTSNLQERNMRAAIEEARTGKKKRNFSIRRALQRKAPEDKEECYSDNELWNEKKIRIIMKKVDLVGIMKRKGNVTRKRASFDKKVKKIYIFSK